jgi:hypothetical protein
MMKIITKDKWLMGISAIGFALYMGFTGFVVLRDKPADYYIYLVSSHALVNGENVYTMSISAYDRIAEQLGIVTHTGPYRYPTLTALLIVPLTLLPLRLGAAIWIGLGGLAVLISALILCSFTTERWKQRAILASTIAFVPVLTTMNLGQVNLFVLLMTVLTLYYLRQDRNVLGGMVFSMSILLKPYAIALIPLMVWHRRWKALGGFLCGVLLINFMSLVVFGVSATTSQFAPIIGLGTHVGLNVDLTTQNLNGLVGRATTGISEPTGLLLYFLAAGLIGGITALAILRKPDSRRFEIESALLIATTLLILPVTWYHYLTMLIIVLAFVITHWSSFAINTTSLLLLSSLILMNLHGLFWKQLANLHPILASFPVFTTLLLWGLALTGVRRYSQGSS